MKENTKYEKEIFVGKMVVDENQPWFEFSTAKPWDEAEIPWVLDNKVRRQILLKVARGPKTYREIVESINFKPGPLLVENNEYETTIAFDWEEETIKNHLLALEWYNLIQFDGETYSTTFPILEISKKEQLEKYVLTIADKWSSLLKEQLTSIQSELDGLSEKTPLPTILIEKITEKIYSLLKSEGILPDTPNIKALWAEELRKERFKEWVQKNF